MTFLQPHVSRLTHPASRIRPLLSLAWLAAALAMMGAAGCAQYTLTGKVIQSDISYVAIVDASDDRFEDPGIAGVTVTLQTDPGQLNHQRVGEAVSGSDGTFTISVNKPGAGILIYDVGLEVRRKGYEGVDHIFRLPPSSKKVLVMLRPGAERLPKKEESLMEQYERFKPH